jgi:hypothetical protein
VSSFRDLLYPNVPTGEVGDKLRWRLNESGRIGVHLY